MMQRWQLFLFSGALTLVAASAQVNGFTPATGFRAFPLQLEGDLMAVSPDGKLAVAKGEFGGGATIKIYDRIRPQGRQLLTTLSRPEWKFFGGLVWADTQHLIFGENGDLDTAFKWNVHTNQGHSLAPAGALPDVAEVLLFGEGVLALTASGPQANGLHYVANGSAMELVSGIGNGYGAGLVSVSGRIYTGDTNDPNFIGNPGQVFRFAPQYANGSLTGLLLEETLSLAGGNGSALGALAVDSEGDLFGTTQQTLTRLSNGIAQPFGEFSGAFPFPTSLAYYGSRFEPFDGDGILIVNGQFTSAGDLFAVTPVPEPASLIALSIGLIALGKRNNAKAHLLES